MSTPSIAELLHLVDRAERGSLLAGEAVQLRAGIRALGAAQEPSDATNTHHATPDAPQERLSGA